LKIGTKTSTATPSIFVSFRQDIDGKPMLKGLPDDRCPCPHWGYVLKGKLTYRFADHEEVFEAGDAFYLPPGHVPLAEAGSELVQFSPSEELAVVDAAMMKNMQAMQGA
jgi:AraC-like ligand binding domain